MIGIKPQEIVDLGRRAKIGSEWMDGEVRSIVGLEADDSVGV
jgi:hypothetical protein